MVGSDWSKSSGESGKEYFPRQKRRDHHRHPARESHFNRSAGEGGPEDAGEVYRGPDDVVEVDGKTEDTVDEDHVGADTPASEGETSLAVSPSYRPAGREADELEKELWKREEMKNFFPLRRMKCFLAVHVACYCMEHITAEMARVWMEIQLRIVLVIFSKLTITIR